MNTGALNSAAAATEIMDLAVRHKPGRHDRLCSVTHDVKVAARADRVLFMLDGRIAAEKRLGKYAGNDAQNGSLSRAEKKRSPFGCSKGASKREITMRLSGKQKLNWNMAVSIPRVRADGEGHMTVNDMAPFMIAQGRRSRNLEMTQANC